jgi:hypothetical protein
MCGKRLGEEKEWKLIWTFGGEEEKTIGYKRQ